MGLFTISLTVETGNRKFSTKIKIINLLAVLRYVEANPVRAGLVVSAKEWLWSSHKERTGEKSRLLMDEIPVGLPKGWGRYVDEPLREKELNRLRQSVNRQSPYGALMWQMEVSKELGLESTLRPRGRPRKQIKWG